MASISSVGCLFRAPYALVHDLSIEGRGLYLDTLDRVTDVRRAWSVLR